MGETDIFTYTDRFVFGLKSLVFRCILMSTPELSDVEMLTDVRNDDNTKGEDKLKSKHKKTKGKKSHKHKKREGKHMKKKAKKRKQKKSSSSEDEDDRKK